MMSMNSAFVHQTSKESGSMSVISVCVCVRERERERVCVCVCRVPCAVCGDGRGETEKEGGRARETKRESERGGGGAAGWGGREGDHYCGQSIHEIWRGDTVIAAFQMKVVEERNKPDKTSQLLYILHFLLVHG